MVLLKRRRTGDPAARIEVSLKTSAPEISLSGSGEDFHLVITLRIASSVQPGRPITIDTRWTVFERSDERVLDIMSRGGFSVYSPDIEGRYISLGLFRINCRSDNKSWNLRDHEHEFITVPGDGSPVQVIHKLDWERLFRYETRFTKADLRGERFRVAMNEDYLGTMWWCWGDIEGCLREKKLHQCSVKDLDLEMGPSERDEFLRSGDWVFGEDTAMLDFEDVTEEDCSIFKVTD